MQTTITLHANGQDFSTYVAMPDSIEKVPAVCIIHDALGMSQDVRNQAEWLASEGYLVAAPDLFNGRTFLGCLRSIMRDFNRREGPLFDKVETVRQWLINHEQSTGKVGIIGFCFGGGFALLMVPTGKFSVASVNYGPLPKDYEAFFDHPCPVVASYGALDRSLKGAAGQLEQVFIKAGVDHDIKEYPNTDHAFMNDHSQDKIPFLIHVIGFVFGGGDYNPESAKDAQARISAFFAKHLKSDDA